MLRITIIGVGLGLVAVVHAGQLKLQPTAAYQDLNRRIGRLAKSAVGRLGIHVEDQQGNVIYSRHARRRFNPASNMKLLTIGAALSLLGPSFRFETTVLGRLKNGHVPRLYLVGGGDPSLDLAMLRRLANKLYKKGVRFVGEVAADDTLFRAGTSPPGFGSFDSDRPYRAGLSALSLNGNAVQVRVSPDTPIGLPPVQLIPQSAYLKLKVELRHKRRRSRIRVISRRQGRSTKIVVRGYLRDRGPVQTFWRRVYHPTRFAAATFVHILRNVGISATGRYRRRRAPQDLPLLASIASRPLASIVQQTGKYSSNVRAELLLLALGIKQYGRPGTFSRGRRVLKKFMATSGLRNFRVTNASGLSRTSRLRPIDLVRLVRRLCQHFDLGPEYLAAMPIGGFDGTLKRLYRHSPAAGFVRAKTGTLSGTTCLSGVVSWQADAFYFSLMAHPRRSTWRMRRLFVAITETLLAHLKDTRRRAPTGEATLFAGHPNK